MTYANDSSPVAAHERLKVGRNEPCPCGSGRKYKKCCLKADEDLARAAAGAQSKSEVRAGVAAQEGSAARGFDRDAQPRKSKQISEADELWRWFNSLNPPTTAQMDELVEKLLALPPQDAEWNEVMHVCAEHDHSDLPAVFRRIAACVPHDGETGMSYFYWAAAEEFARNGFCALLPEIAAGYAQLDAASYDADSLAHIEDILLASHFETEALELAERFLPVVVEDDGLMPYAATEKCNLIFQLRAGVALRSDHRAAALPLTIAQRLGQDLGERVDIEVLDRAAQVVCDTSDPAWTRAHFDFGQSDRRKNEQAWQDCLRLYSVLLRVSREAWRIDGLPSGCGFVGLSRLLTSIYRAQSEAKSERRGKGRAKDQPRNLLDYLTPSGMEQRIARECRDLLGMNVARAQILVDAHGVLVDFAARHHLIPEGAAAATRAELVRLRGVLASR